MSMRSSFTSLPDHSCRGRRALARHLAGRSGRAVRNRSTGVWTVTRAPGDAKITPQQMWDMNGFRYSIPPREIVETYHGNSPLAPKHPLGVYFRHKMPEPL
jgi:hypothetical protein